MRTRNPVISTAHKQFMSRTSSIYGGMVKRFAGKQNKQGRWIKVGRKVPFTLAEFRTWLTGMLGGQEHGVISCPYCKAWVTIANLAVDHEIPVDRGGSLGLENLGLPCQPCNARKGRLLPAEYRALCELLWTWHPDAATDVRHRLEISVQLAAQRRFTITKQAAARAGAGIAQKRALTNSTVPRPIGGAGIAQRATVGHGGLKF